MQTVHYNLMRNPLACLLAVSVAAPGALLVRAQQRSAMQTSILESHDGMTIGVDPWTQSSRYREKFPKKSPLSAGIVALRLSLHNNAEDSIRVDLQRIRLLIQVSDENRQELEPLSPDDVADAVLLKKNGKDPTARRVPLPVPVGKSAPGRDKNWTEFRDDCQNASPPSDVVAPRNTVEGLLYFDVRGEMDLLKTARLYIPNLVIMTSNQPLLYFDIDLSRAPAN